MTKKINTTVKRISWRHKKDDAKWYVLSVPPRYENSVKEALQQRVKATETQNLIQEILVPVQKKIVVKKGKQSIIEETIYPGYVLVKMKLNPKTWEMIGNTEGVRGFVKTDKYPKPLPEKQVQAIMKYMEVKQPEYKISFTVGEAVKIKSDAFKDFMGSIESIDVEKGTVQVKISFLGREVPVDLDISEIEKLS